MSEREEGGEATRHSGVLVGYIHSEMGERGCPLDEKRTGITNIGREGVGVKCGMVQGKRRGVGDTDGYGVR